MDKTTTQKFFLFLKIARTIFIHSPKDKNPFVKIMLYPPPCGRLQYLTTLLLSPLCCISVATAHS